MANWFVRSRPTTQWANGVAKSLGDRVVATSAVNYLGIHFECTTAGTTGGSEPTWNTTVGGTTADNTATWTTRGSANTWAASAAYALGDRVIATTSATAVRQNYVYECTTAGTAGGSEPAWVTTTPDSSTTTDNTVTWTLRKPTTWNNAHPYLVRIDGDTTGTGKLNGGDTIYVSKNHSENTPSSTSFIPAMTWLNPVVVICVDDTGDTASPTTVATTGVVATSGAAGCDLSISNAVVYGITFQAGTATHYGALALGTSGSGFLKLVNCLIKENSSSNGAGIYIQITGGQGRVILINTPIELTNAGQQVNINKDKFEWRNTSPAFTGTVPTNALDIPGNSMNHVVMENLDLSSISTKLFNTVTTGDMLHDIRLTNCRLHSSVTISDGIDTSNRLLSIKLLNCSSSSVNYDYRHVMDRGDVYTETTLVMSGGATDGTTPVSWKIVTNTYPTFSFPLTTIPIIRWNDSTGSSVTATIEILHDSSTNLTDGEIWIEVDYLGSSSYPLGSSISDCKSDILATAADQTTSSATWTTTGMSNPNKQKLSVTFTPNMVGEIRARVCVAKISKTLYINPEIVMS